MYKTKRYLFVTCSSEKCNTVTKTFLYLVYLFKNHYFFANIGTAHNVSLHIWGNFIIYYKSVHVWASA